MDIKRVVITGMGALTPIGNSVDEYWQNLVAGKSGAEAITKFYASLFKTQFACEVKNFDPLEIMNRKDARKLDLFSIYAMATSDEAIHDSGIDLEKVNLNRAGVVWGSGIGGMKTFQEESFNFKDGDGSPRFNPFFVPKIIDATPQPVVVALFFSLSSCSLSSFISLSLSSVIMHSPHTYVLL